jgi:hypothetical protein
VCEMCYLQEKDDKKIGHNQLLASLYNKSTSCCELQ